MKKEKRNPRSHELIREMIKLYYPQSIRDIPDMLKDMFADTMEDMLSLYAKGTSDRDISDVINEIYGFSLSHETISNIVDRVQPRFIEWQNRRLDKVYPFVYMDALTSEQSTVMSAWVKLKTRLPY